MYDLGIGYGLGSLRTIFGIILMVFIILWIIRRPIIGVITFIFFQIAQPYFLNFNPFLFGEFHLPRLIAIITLLSFFANNIFSKTKTYSFYAPIQNWLMFFILILMIISCKFNNLIIADNQTVGDFFKMVVVYFMITCVVRSKKDVNICGWAIIISGLIIAFKGFQNYRTEGLNVPYWGMNYNAFGGSLALLLPLLIIYIARTKNFILKSLLGLGIVISSLSLFRTGSRSSFLAFSIASFFILIYFLLSKGYKKYVFFLFPLVFVLILSRTPEKIWERLNTIKTYKEDASAMGRIYAWQAGVEMMKEKPFFGVGPGQFVEMFPDYSNREVVEAIGRRRIAPHNILVAIGAQYGLIALFCWILMVFFLFIDSIRIIRHSSGDPKERYFLDTIVALSISCLAWQVFGMFGTSLYSADPHIYASLVIASKKFIKKRNA